MKTRTFCVIVLVLVLGSLDVAPRATAMYASTGVWRNYTTADGLANNTVNAIAIDGLGHKWFGTEGGVSKFDGSTWVTYDTSNSGLVSDLVDAIAIDRAGHKWIGTWNGASKFDDTNWTTYDTSNSGLADNYVKVIGVDLYGDLWFGTYQGGATWFNDESMWLTFIPSNSGLGGHRVEDIAFDSLGHVWFSSLEPASGLNGGVGPMWAYAKGVQEFDGTNWTTYDTSNSDLIVDWVWDIEVDSQGHKWFAAWGGVSEFDGTSWTNYGTPNSGLANAYVYVMAIDDDGTKWFGYGYYDAGVTKFDGTTWVTYNTASSGLVNDHVNAIAIDRAGHKWFGTDGGVSEYIPDGVPGSVTVAGGGNISSSDGSTTLTFAAGVVPTDLEVMFIPDAVSYPASLSGIGHYFELYAVASGTSGPPVETIPGTYTIVVQYSNGEVFPADENTLALYNWDGTQWVREPTSVLDTDANTVTATPDRFSHWAVLGERRTDLRDIYLPLVVKNAGW